MLTHEVRRPAATPPQLAGPIAETTVRGGFFWGVIRLAIGWTFFWAFLDRLLALGFSTGRDPETGTIDFFGPAAWINGGSPTEGFLRFGLHSKEPFEGFYASLAGQWWIDWVYMLSMLLIGVALMAGILTRLAAFGAFVWMLVFYTAAALWPEHNPILDYRLVYAVALVAIVWVGAGRYLGFGRRWEKTSVGRFHPLLR